MMICAVALLAEYILMVIVYKINNKYRQNETFDDFADTALITRNQMRNYPPMVDIEGTIEEQRKRGI